LLFGLIFRAFFKFSAFVDTLVVLALVVGLGACSYFELLDSFELSGLMVPSCTPKTYESLYDF